MLLSVVTAKEMPGVSQQNFSLPQKGTRKKVVAKTPADLPALGTWAVSPGVPHHRSGTNP